MAQKDAAAALSDACAGTKEVSQKDRIAQGETLWFHGSPVAAEPGTFALDTGGDRIVVINRKDVRSVEQSDDGFLVEVPVGTNVIARMESVVKVEAGTCDCGEKHARPDADKLALQVGHGDSTRDPFNVLEYCWYVYRWVTVCKWVKFGNRVRRVCTLEFQQVWVCRTDKYPGPLF
jgi:hypothetical protein